MFVVAGGISPVILIAGASVGAVVGAGIEEVAKSEGGGASVDEERAAVALGAFGRGGLLKNPIESGGASALGATGGADNEVRVGATFDIEGLIGSVLVTVIAGRVVGATVLKPPALPALAFELTAATFESVTRALSLSNALASASRFSSMLSICRPGMLLAPAGRAQEVRPFCMPDQLGMPPPGVVVSCRTVITVPPPFRAGVLVLPPPLGSETAVWRPGVVGLVVVDGGSRRESRFDRPGVVGMEPVIRVGLVDKLVLDTPRILPLVHMSALPGESPPDPGSFGESEGNGNLFSLPGSRSSSQTE